MDPTTNAMKRYQIINNVLRSYFISCNINKLKMLAFIGSFIYECARKIIAKILKIQSFLGFWVMSQLLQSNHDFFVKVIWALINF